MGLTKTYQKFNIAVPTTTKASENYQSTTKYQAIHIRRCFKIYTGKDLCWSLFLMQFQVFSYSFIKKETRHRYFPLKLLRACFFYRTPPADCLEEHNILLKIIPIAISNGISKAYYRKGFSFVFWDQYTVDSWSLL